MFPVLKRSDCCGFITDSTLTNTPIISTASAWLNKQMLQLHEWFLVKRVFLIKIDKNSGVFGVFLIQLSFWVCLKRLLLGYFYEVSFMMVRSLRFLWSVPIHGAQGQYSHQSTIRVNSCPRVLGHASRSPAASLHADFWLFLNPSPPKQNIAFFCTVNKGIYQEWRRWDG